MARMKLSRPVLGNLGKPKKKSFAAELAEKSWKQQILETKLPHEWPCHMETYPKNYWGNEVKDWAIAGPNLSPNR